MQPEIIPAILAHTSAELKEQWSVFSKLKPKMVQVDVCDGKFAGPKTVSADDVKKLKLPAFEVDLMVHDPASAALEWILAGASRVIFHIETVDDPSVVVDLCRLYNTEVAVALKPETPIQKIVDVLPLVDRVQCKGVHPGASGQKFQSRVLKTVRELHTRHPKLGIAVDGGVNRETIAELRAAGVSSFAIGSALLDAVDIKKEFHVLETLLH